MIADMMPGTEEQLQKELTSAYVGIDPTADSLHIGHLVSVMMLKHFQRAGHRPIALVGGATGMIGDPSMKSAERNLLDEATLRHNQDCIKKQLAKFLDFDSDAPNAAKLVNNYDWMKDYSFLNFIRDIGKHITVNYMMAKDSVKKRLSRESSVGFYQAYAVAYSLAEPFFTDLSRLTTCLVISGKQRRLLVEISFYADLTVTAVHITPAVFVCVFTPLDKVEVIFRCLVGKACGADFCPLD